MRIAIISDTHFPARGRVLPDECGARLVAADLILHAGDHCDAEALSTLRHLGPPLISVHGNVDGADVRRRLPRQTAFDADGVRIGMIHDAGPTAGRSTRLRRLFPGAEVVVFGHSHIPLVERAADGFLIVNPGSPTDRRRQPVHTMAELLIAPGAPVEAVIIPLDGPDGGGSENE
jgi:uncharacterized protein